MTRGDSPSSAAGWKAHAVVLAAGAFLALPILVLDLAFLGPTGGGWISLDFRGFAIGAYLALWLSESLLATVLVALVRGRSAGLAIGAHVLAVVALVMAGGLWLALADARSHARYREHEVEVAQARERARSELRVVEWRVVPGSEPPRVAVTFEASVPGEITLDEIDTSALPGLGVLSATFVIPAGRRTFELESFEHGLLPGARERMRVEWLAHGTSIPIRFELCRPLCTEYEAAEDEVVLELPAIRTE